MDSFKVSNFRIFGEEGTEVSFTPVTILTGSNSSGKSSFVKAFVAFGDYIASLIEDEKNKNIFNPSAHKLNLVRTDLNLKGFSNVINRNSGESKIISFSYDCRPKCALGRTYNVCYSFSHSKSLDLEHGELYSIEVKSNGEKVLSYNCANGRQHFNFGDVVLNDFISLYGEIIKPIFEEDFYDDETKRYIVDNSDLKIDFETKDELKPIFPIENQESIQDHISRQKAFIKYAFEGILFYLPVLDYFKKWSKKESLSFLRKISTISNDIIENANSAIEALANMYEADATESFYDYYIKLERSLLRHYDRAGRNIYVDNASAIQPSFENWILKHVQCPFDKDYFDNKPRWWKNYKISKSDPKFYGAYYALIIIQIIVAKSSNDDNLFSDYVETINGTHHFHKLYLAFEKYIVALFRELLLPIDLSNIIYNSESFTRVQRLFSYEDNSLFVRTIKRYQQCSNRLEKQVSNVHFGYFGVNRKELVYKPGDFIKKWAGKEGLNIFESFQIKDLEGLGVQVSIDEENLADLGRGVTQLFFLLLQVEVAIIETWVKKCDISLAIREQHTISPRYHNTSSDAQTRYPYEANNARQIIAIEEPEVSLHPCFQSRLADIFADAIRLVPNLLFIIETHSEYLVRRTQAIVAGFDTEEQFKNNPFSVHYFLNDGSAYEMVYQESGRFSNSFGPGFFDEAGRSSIEILRKEKMLKK